MQTEKEKWVNDALQSIDGASRASTPDMTDAVMSRLDTAARYTIPVAKNDNSLIWRIAASVVFLVLLNGVTVFSYQNNIRQKQEAMVSQAAASELGFGQKTGSDMGTVIFGN